MNNSANRKILFVDDDIKLLKVIEHHFRDIFPVDVAFSGTDALKLLTEKNTYAVIVSDYRMPDMDGAAFLSRAKHLAADSVRVLFTGHADLEMAIRAVNEGEIFRFVSKPCPFNSLAQVLAAALEKYGLQTMTRPEKESEINTRSLLTPEEITLLLRGEPAGRES
jgi:DNA-binding NtrC family response regulator